jgi:tetratricopeptide (TPR) repeat protein
MRRVLVVFLAALWGTAAGADTKQVDELDQLFGKLKTTTETDEQRTAQSRIWSIWMQSGSVTQDLILQQATAAMVDEEYYTSEAMLNVLIGKQPGDAEPYNKRAELYFLMGRLDEALKDTDATLEREPRHFGALAGKGLILQRMGREKDALEAYHQALAINPNLTGVAAAAKLIEKTNPGL